MVRISTQEDPDGLVRATKCPLIEGSLTPMPENPRASVLQADTASPPCRLDVSDEDVAVSFVQP